MKKFLALLILACPLFAWADTLLETPNYSLNIHLNNEYDGPYKDEGVKGLSQENRDDIYQQAGMFKSLSIKNENKDAAGSIFLVHSKKTITADILMSETLGWLIKDDLKTTPCPNYRFLDFAPTCYIRTLKNEVRDVSFIVYSGINTFGTDAIVLVALTGQTTDYGYDYRTIKNSTYTSANVIYYDLLNSVKINIK